MKSIEAEAKSVDEAIFKGLEELGLSIDEVDIEIIDEGTKGFLNIIGSKPAKVCIRQKIDNGNKAVEFIEGLLDRMGIPAQVSKETNEQTVNVNIKGEKIGQIIGHRGEVLDAIQYLTSLVVNKNREEYLRVTVDAESYRLKREESLVRLAKRMAAKVQRTGRKVVLEPMNPYERRILHATLQGNKRVTTMSEGNEPYRRVVILPKH